MLSLLKSFKNRYFQRIFVCYALVILCFVLGFEMYFVTSGYQREAIVQRENLKSEATILAQVVDEKFSMLSDTCTQLLDDTKIKKFCSQSAVIQSTLDIFDRVELCEMLSHFRYMNGISSSMAILLPRNGTVIDTQSLWNSEERYLQSIGIYEEDFSENLYAQVRDSYGSLVMLPIEGSKDIAIARSLDVFTDLKQVFFFRVSQLSLSKIVRQHLSSDAYDFAIIDEDLPILTIGDGMHDIAYEEFAIPSGLFRWNYQIKLPVAQFTLFSTRDIVFLTIFLLLLVISMALVISSFTYYPVMQTLRKLGIFHPTGDELSALHRRFEEIRQSEIEMEGQTSQYYNTARNNLLISMLHGSFAGRVTNDTMSLFGIPFDNDNHPLYVVMVIAGETERPEEQIAKDLLALHNYFVLNRIPAVKCVTPESEIVVILYAKNTAAEEARMKKLSRFVLMIQEFCHDSMQEYACLSGLPHHGLLGISKSYQEAQEERAEVETGAVGSYYFPLDWEIQLIAQLRAGNDKTVERIIRELRDENMARKLDAAGHARLMTLLTEMLQRISLETNVEPDNFVHRIVNIRENDNQEAAWSELNGLAQALCLTPDDMDASQSVGERIRVYLHENFRDINLSQKAIAEEFHVSCPNLSKAFRNATGKNFIDYLHELRCQTAKIAFDQGETDILKVAHACGYDNEVTFRRKFFRMYAVSPYQYVQKTKKN